MFARTKTRTRGLPLLLWVALSLAGCGADGFTAPVPTSISVDVDDLRFTAWDESRQLVATVSDESGMPLEATVTWTVADPTIAEVTPTGVVTSLANGTTVVTASAGTATASVSVSVDAPGPFNIEISFVSSVPAGHYAAIERVERRWETIIRSELPAVDFSANPLPANACVTTQAEVNGVVDDILVFIVARFVDGPGGAVAGGQPCLLREGSDLPVAGTVVFDYQDLATMSPEETELLLTHELAHVLGFGDVWTHLGYLAEPVSELGPSADPHFTGPLAVAAFDAAGGEAYAGGKVPVHGLGFRGTIDRHWRESVFGDELMTPFLDEGGLSALSAVTIQSLADIGYEVDVTAADAFGLESDLARARSSMSFDVQNDAPGLPVYRVTSDGRISVLSSNGSSPSSPRARRDSAR